MPETGAPNESTVRVLPNARGVQQVALSAQAWFAYTAGDRAQRGGWRRNRACADSLGQAQAQALSSTTPPSHNSLLDAFMGAAIGVSLLRNGGSVQARGSFFLELPPQPLLKSRDGTDV